MLAPATIPEEYKAWNAAHGAPHGRHIRLRRLKEKLFSADQLCRALGPFSIQLNNTTREFEYPWAFTTGQIRPGMRVLEIGGGLAGFQFALGTAGCRVLNVDPGMKSETVDWRSDAKSIARLNSLFKTAVEVRPTTIENANLADNESFFNGCNLLRFAFLI